MENNIPSFYRKILVTGGAGFIGSHFISRLLKKESIKIYNLDKLTYASNTSFIDNEIIQNKSLKDKNYKLIRIDLKDSKKVKETIKDIDPDCIINFAAESHVDRSIDNPEIFIESNILGTFNLLEAARIHWRNLPYQRAEKFIFHHISTDEVFGSLGQNGKFSENTAYDPRSPYSASKASSDHLVSSWFHTYDLPTLITNCSNNYGPWQFPEKLIPLVILKALKNQSIPIYGDGKNIRDWLFVSDHIDALMLVLSKAKRGTKYCIGGNNEITNLNLVKLICSILNELNPNDKPYEDLISFVDDRPGHDMRYSIDFSCIKRDFGWVPKTDIYTGIRNTVKWYMKNSDWCNSVLERSKYQLGRIGEI